MLTQRKRQQDVVMHLYALRATKFSSQYPK